MFRKLKIAHRFGLILFLIFIITLPIITTIMYYFFRENAMREVADKAVLAINYMESLRKYIGKELRPAVNRDMPGKFMLEGQVGFYILRKVAHNLQEVQPYYMYKQASDNPLAPENKADYYEKQILMFFSNDPNLKELTGLRKDRGSPLYYIARPVRVDRDECMRCHGDPLFAPKEQVEKYGTATGYNYRKDAVVGTNIIYVPASVPISIAMRSTIAVAIVFTVLFVLLYLIITLLIKKSIISPIEHFVSVANQVSKGQFDNKFEVNTQDELKVLAEAFTRMKTSLVMMMDMMKKTGQKL